MTRSGGGDAGALAQGLRHEITGVGLRALAAKALHVAVLAPERLVDTYDNAAAGWLSLPIFPPRHRGAPPRFSPLSPEFWSAFWSLVEIPTRPSDRLEFTTQTIQLAAMLPPGLTARVANVAEGFPGVARAAAGGLPTPFRLKDLARCPTDSVGGQFHQQVLSGRVDLQSIANERAALASLSPPLDYLNMRIMQCYPLWRMVAGYHRGRLDDIGMAAFQMAQFGHHYSSVFSGIVLASIALQRPAGLEIVLDSMFKGWMHGRQTPQLLDAPWEDLWDLPLAQVRARLGVTPFDSPMGAVQQMLDSDALER